MSKKNKRELVKDCIEQGNMTKQEIADELGMSVASVSTQMTYLRWMDNYILIDPETKVLSFTDQETFEAAEAAKKANRKTKSTSTRTPEERAAAVAKTLGNQNKQLATWKTKLEAAEEMLEEHADEAAELAVKEAEAMVALLEVKIVRNEVLADDLPAPVEAEEEPADVEEADEETAELL